ALGGCDRAPAADEDARERTLDASQDAADDRADAGTGADAPGFAPDAFTLQRLCHGGMNRVGASVDPDLIEFDCHAAFAFEPARLLNRGDDAAQHRPGRDEDAIVL